MTYTYSDEVLADSPYLYWKFDETSGTTANDSSGNSRNGTYVNGVVLNQTSVVPNEGKSVDLDGTNDYVEYTLGADITGNFSLEIWFNVDSYSNYPGLFGAWTANSNGNYGTNLQLSDTGTFDINVARNNFNFWELNAGGFGSISTGTRYHVVLVVDDTNNVVKLFINGSQVGTNQTITNAVGLGANGKKIRVGSVGAITNGGWNGRVDNFAVYTTALSGTRITAHYEAGFGPKITPTVTNIGLDGIDAAFASTSNATVNCQITNVSIQSHLATVKVDELNTSELTNVSISGQDASVIATTNVTITTDLSNISIEANNPILQIQSGVTILAQDGNININDSSATVVINLIITTGSTNIDIAANEVLPLYTGLVKSKDPVHYFRFTPQEDYSTVIDIGRVPIAGSSWNLDSADWNSGIPGDSESDSVELHGLAGSSSEAILFNTQNIFNTNNLLDLNGTIEFWIKTSSENIAILAMDGNNDSSTGELRTFYLGLHNGYLSFVRFGVPSTIFVTASNSYLADNSWHHIVLTKSYNAQTQTFTNTSYVDNEPTNIVLSLYTFITYNGIFNDRRSIGTYQNDSGVVNAFTYQFNLDELAIYDRAFTSSDVNDHYIAGSGTFGTSIQPVVTNINIAGQDAGKNILVTPTKSNISIKFNGSIINDGDGSTSILVSDSNIKINETNSTISAVSFLTINQQVSNINVNDTITRVRDKSVFFKFISSQDTALSATDAEDLLNLNYGGLLYNQTKKLLFRIGNLNVNPTSFEITITTKESAILPAITLSTDNITFNNSVTINNVLPNNISDIIYVKFDVNYIDTLGPGTFLINVEQVND
jgi:hypothetical protein